MPEEKCLRLQLMIHVKLGWLDVPKNSGQSQITSISPKSQIPPFNETKPLFPLVTTKKPKILINVKHFLGDIL